MGSFKTLLTAFQQGKQLANAETWKNRQMAGNAIASVLAAGVLISRWFGVNIDVLPDDLESIAAGAAVVAALLLNGAGVAATSVTVGLPPKQTEKAQGVGD